MRAFFSERVRARDRARARTEPEPEPSPSPNLNRFFIEARDLGSGTGPVSLGKKALIGTCP